MRVFGICLALTIVVVTPGLAQDTLTFENGNVITGRIKRLERGEVTLDIPIADGDVFVSWERVVLVESARVFQFQTTDGERFLGRIQPETDPETGTLVVEFGGVTQTYQRDDIVLVVETVGGLAGLLRIGVGAGVTLAKSNDQRQLNADSSVSYETPNYTISANTNSIFNRQRDTDDTNRHSIDILFTRAIRSRWALGAINNYLTNNEQSLDLRTVVGGGPVFTVVRNNAFELSTLGGLVWNNERYASDAELDTNDDLEGLLGVELSFFEFKQWELASTYLFYPSITAEGRRRQTLNAQLRLRLIRGKPFWLNFSQTLNLDSDPPKGTPGTDYLTTTSLSWTFP
jgi:putative salt-induced outer membrane protein YdiY